MLIANGQGLQDGQSHFWFVIACVVQEIISILGGQPPNPQECPVPRGQTSFCPVPDKSKLIVLVVLVNGAENVKAFSFVAIVVVNNTPLL